MVPFIAGFWAGGMVACLFTAMREYAELDDTLIQSLRVQRRVDAWFIDRACTNPHCVRGQLVRSRDGVTVRLEVKS